MRNQIRASIGQVFESDERKHFIYVFFQFWTSGEYIDIEYEFVVLSIKFSVMALLMKMENSELAIVVKNMISQ